MMQGYPESKSGVLGVFSSLYGENKILNEGYCKVFVAKFTLPGKEDI